MNQDFPRYNALDSACMMEIHDHIWPLLEKDGYTFTYNLTVSLYPVLAFMQARGMKVNHILLEETKKEVLEKSKRLQEELDGIVGHVLNVNSPKMVANYFFVELGRPPILNPKTKKITTDDLALQKLARGTVKNPGLPQAKLIQEIRGLQKLYGTYLDIKFDADNRMRGAYNPRGTKFGRLSSSKTIFDTGMNFQNLPQEFKKFLVADEGYVLVEVDKRQAEWVIVAYASNDANMIQAIQRNEDVHSHTASLMFGLPHDLIKYENKIIGHTTSSEAIHNIRMQDDILRKVYTDSWPMGMSLRQCGKKSNHGLNYDERYKNFALINQMAERESKNIVELYHRIYPGIHLWHESVKRQLQKDRTLTNCFGRKVRFMGEWAQDLWKSAYSFLPQSTVVDSLNLGMVHIYNDQVLTQRYNVDILAQVHDSILLQVPIHIVQDKIKWGIFKNKVYSYISPTIKYNNNFFEVATDMKVGKNWGEYKKDTNPLGMQDYENWETMNSRIAKWGKMDVKGA